MINFCLVPVPVQITIALCLNEWLGKQSNGANKIAKGHVLPRRDQSLFKGFDTLIICMQMSTGSYKKVISSH